MRGKLRMHWSYTMRRAVIEYAMEERRSGCDNAPEKAAKHFNVPVGNIREAALELTGIKKAAKKAKRLIYQRKETPVRVAMNAYILKEATALRKNRRTVSIRSIIHLGKSFINNQVDIGAVLPQHRGKELQCSRTWAHKWLQQHVFVSRAVTCKRRDQCVNIDQVPLALDNQSNQTFCEAAELKDGAGCNQACNGNECNVKVLGAKEPIDWACLGEAFTDAIDKKGGDEKGEDTDQSESSGTSSA